MAKIRKNKRRKRFQYDKNRKRMKKSNLPKVKCQVIDKHWDRKKSTVKNLKGMGLAFNVNDDIVTKTTDQDVKKEPTEVLQALECEANALREKSYRLPKNQVEFITYMLDKYGEDCRAMTRDKRNHAQLTWKQFRKKINVFKSIPEQYNAFLQSRKGKELETKPTSLNYDDDDE